MFDGVVKRNQKGLPFWGGRLQKKRRLNTIFEAEERLKYASGSWLFGRGIWVMHESWHANIRYRPHVARWLFFRKVPKGQPYISGSLGGN